MDHDVEVIDRLARMDVKLDQLLSSVGDHEVRLRALEKAKWMIVGAASAGGGAMGAIASQLMGA